MEFDLNTVEQIKHILPFKDSKSLAAPSCELTKNMEILVECEAYLLDSTEM